jgi:hypothetical protein
MCRTSQKKQRVLRSELKIQSVWGTAPVSRQVTMLSVDHFFWLCHFFTFLQSNSKKYSGISRFVKFWFDCSQLLLLFVFVLTQHSRTKLFGGKNKRNISQKSCGISFFAATVLFFCFHLQKAIGTKVTVTGGIQNEKKGE